MGVPEEIRALNGELEASISVLKRVSAFYDGFVQKPESAARSVENAIVLSDIFVSYYTCLETAFLRISQFFENTLDQRRWHRDVLRKMMPDNPGNSKAGHFGQDFARPGRAPSFPAFQKILFRFRLRLGPSGAGGNQVPFGAAPRAGGVAGLQRISGGSGPRRRAGPIGPFCCLRVRGWSSPYGFWPGAFARFSANASPYSGSQDRTFPSGVLPHIVSDTVGPLSRRHITI
jgi:hypothetical protein